MFTAQEIRDYLGITTEREISTAELDKLRDRAIEILEMKTANYYGIEKEVTIVVPGGLSVALWLPNFFKEITSIRYRYAYGESAWVDETGYTLQYGRMLNRAGGEIWGIENEVEITGIIGYGTEEAPGPFPGIVKQALLGVIGYILARRGMEGYSKMSSPSTSIQFNKLEEAPFVQDLLDSEYNLARAPI